MKKRVISLLALSLVLLLTFCGCTGKQSESFAENKAEHGGGKTQTATALPHPDSLPKAPEYEIIKDDRSLKNADGEVAIEYYFDLVVLKGDDEATEKINNSLEAARDAFFADEADMMSNLEAIYESSDAGWANFASAEVTYNEKGIFSVAYYFEWYMGGVSNRWSAGAVFDTETGEQLTMEKLVGMERGALEEQVRIIVVNAANENYGEEFYTYSDAAEYTLEEFGFYVSDGKIVLTVPPYEIGALTSGYEIETDLNVKTNEE